MKIRILTAVGGHPCGAVVEAAEADARTWIGRTQAEPVPVAARQADVEQATAEPDAEQAVSRRGAKGRRKRRG